MQLGCHISIAKGYAQAALDAVSIGARTFQFFVRNPRGAASSALVQEDVQELEDIITKNTFAPLLAHAAYTLNPCSAKPETRAFALQAMQEDVDKLGHLPCHLYNFHPGNHTGLGVDAGIEHIAACINAVKLPNMKMRLLLETMPGSGTEIGSRFEELAAIIGAVANKDQIGICLDTCHIFAAGYDIRHNAEKILDEFDRVIGLRYLQAVHLNDSVHPLGSKKDRHANIGEGEIGLEPLVRFLSLEPVKQLPVFLETRNDLAGHKREINLIQEVVSKIS